MIGQMAIAIAAIVAARRMKLWSLNANLFFKEPQQLTKVKLKKSLVKNISLQRCNCNIFGLTDTVALFAKEAGFFSDLGCSSWQVLSKTKSVTPHFFYISDITNSSSFNGKICKISNLIYM